MSNLFDQWISSIFDRWMRELSHREIARALRSLSTDYVQKRNRIRGKAFAGRGKQAASLLYYGTRHFVSVREVLFALNTPQNDPGAIVDLGCGTGVAGAAWSLHCGGERAIVGVELDRDVIREAVMTYESFHLKGHVIRCHLSKFRWPKPPIGIVAAFTVNELKEKDREDLWQNLEKQVGNGSQVLILEPLAVQITPWWEDWTIRAGTMGGRADEWHFDIELPEQVTLLGTSAGLRPGKIGARTLWMGS